MLVKHFGIVARDFSFAEANTCEGVVGAIGGATYLLTSPYLYREPVCHSTEGHLCCEDEAFGGEILREYAPDFAVIGTVSACVAIPKSHIHRRIPEIFDDGEQWPVLSGRIQCTVLSGGRVQL